MIQHGETGSDYHGFGCETKMLRLFYYLLIGLSWAGHIMNRTNNKRTINAVNCQSRVGRETFREIQPKRLRPLDDVIVVITYRGEVCSEKLFPAVYDMTFNFIMTHKRIMLFYIILSPSVVQ